MGRTIECPVQILNGGNDFTLNEEGRPITEEVYISSQRDLDLQAQEPIFSTTEKGCLILS